MGGGLLPNENKLGLDCSDCSDCSSDFLEPKIKSNIPPPRLLLVLLCFLLDLDRDLDLRDLDL